jgi:hypothetical protein
MVREFRLRFLLLCAAGLPLGAAPLWALSGWRAAAAFALTFSIVAGDFLWISLVVQRVLGEEQPRKRAGTVLFVGMLARTLLLLLSLYGILAILPKQSLGVIAGIGGPLVLLALAGAVRTRG